MNVALYELAQATTETIYMVGLAAVAACVLGLPLGFIVVVTSAGHLLPKPKLCWILGVLINVLRSVPFIILMIMLMPITKYVVGTSIGVNAAVVPLAVGATPFFARLVEVALREVDPGMIQMGRAIGASNWQIIRHILLPEAKVAIVSAVTITLVALVGYSAMAGVIGGGGLGDLAIRHGYQRFQPDVMVVTTALMIGLVQIFQSVGDQIARRADKRRH